MATIKQAKAWARKYPNFMTPHSIAISHIEGKPDFFVELSQGQGFNHETIYGVTVIKALTPASVEEQGRKFTTIHQYDKLNKVLSDRAEAESYFRAVIAEVEAA